MWRLSVSIVLYIGTVKILKYNLLHCEIHKQYFNNILQITTLNTYLNHYIKYFSLMKQLMNIRSLLLGPSGWWKTALATQSCPRSRTNKRRGQTSRWSQFNRGLGQREEKKWCQGRVRMEQGTIVEGWHKSHRLLTG